jgi:hypothetical protein
MGPEISLPCSQQTGNTTPTPFLKINLNIFLLAEAMSSLWSSLLYALITRLRYACLKNENYYLSLFLACDFNVLTSGCIHKLQRCYIFKSFE